MTRDVVELLRVAVAGNESAPGAVRAAMSELHWLGWPLGDAMLVASELVTNAVLHSGCGPADLIEVSVDQHDDGIIISVRDPGRSGKVAVATDESVEVGGGWGLGIVAALSREWGAERHDGYRVWAAVPLGSAA